VSTTIITTIRKICTAVVSIIWHKEELSQSKQLGISMVVFAILLDMVNKEAKKSKGKDKEN